MGRPALRTERSKSDFKVVKKCTGCEKEIPVACKTCPLCKTQVVSSKPNRTEDGEKDSPSKVRRTERVRRERPDFFNSLEVDKRFKKKRRRKESTVETTSTISSKTSSESSPGAPSDNPRKRRGRPKSLSQPEPAEKTPESHSPEEEDIYGHLPAEKLLQYQVILSEINRKICTQTFNPL